MKTYVEWGGDVERLKTFFRNNADVRNVLEFASAHEKPGGWYEVAEVTLRLSANGVKTSRREVIAGFKSLAALGCGWFKTGRRGWPTRFEFKLDPKHLHGLATGHISPPARPASPARILEHKFRLRPDQEIVLQLPSDLSKREVGRIAEFLKTLPFEDAGLSVAA